MNYQNSLLIKYNLFETNKYLIQNIKHLLQQLLSCGLSIGCD